MDPQTPIEPPPPAYEAEHEFDRKISDALERSLSISNQAQQPLNLPPGEDEWEEWDEARFEAAAALTRAREQSQEIEQPSLPVAPRSSEKERLRKQDSWQPGHRSGEASSSTSSASVPQPKRRLPACPPSKERPSWYSEAQLDASASSGSSQNNQVSLPPLVHHLPPEEAELDEPLPPFTAVGPSLEGPPFEEVVRQPPRLPPASNIDSPPQSPLDSVEDSLPDPHSLAESSSRREYGERFRSTSPRQSLTSSMPRTVSVLPSSSRPPPMRFDASVAYSKHRNVNVSPSEAESREPVNASALYNSAVSSLFGSSQIPRKPIPSRNDTSAGSGANRSEIPPASLIRHAPSPNPYHPMQNQASVPIPHPPYSQPLSQQSQQVVPSLYGHQFLGPTPGPSPATPPPSNWPPPTNSPGGGYRR